MDVLKETLRLHLIKSLIRYFPVPVEGVGG